MNILEIVGQLADLKDVDYRNTLAVATLVELLIAKGVFSRQEFTAKARELDQASLADILASRRNKAMRPSEDGKPQHSFRSCRPSAAAISDSPLTTVYKAPDSNA